MSSFIRPEVHSMITRYREALVGAGVQILGALMIFKGLGIVPFVGIALLVIGVALTFIGLQRARFRQAGQGPGVVTLDEGRIAYFGPLTGGAVVLAHLNRITLDPTGDPTHWVLDHDDGPQLSIPVTAEGAERLFDAFAQLSGLKTERMLAQLNTTSPHAVVIWERASLSAERKRLH